MMDDVELIVIGDVTDSIKKLLLDNVKNLISRGVRMINLRFFTEKVPVRYLEDVRDVLLENIVVSIRIYEHKLNELNDEIHRLAKSCKEVIVISSEEQALSRVTCLLTNQNNCSQ
ncbi:MAG: hypothetical protein QW701_00950 [Candidatus Nezhaarchaeales archaeon]